MSSLSHFFKWMRKNGDMKHNPVLKVQLPKKPERLPSSVSEAGLNRLWKSFDLHADKPDFRSLRDQAIIGLLYGSGLRRSELIQLKEKDIDRDRNTLRIVGKGRKYRQVPVNEQMIELLKQLKEVSIETWGPDKPDNVILTDSGNLCYPKFVHNKVVEMLGSVTTSKKRSPHVLRHSMATHLMDHGAELNGVKEILGHSSLAATQVYTHNSISRLKDVYKFSHPKSRSNP
jgi:integrase/recombinase XerC